jgi:hypothetical protein
LRSIISQKTRPKHETCCKQHFLFLLCSIRNVYAKTGSGSRHRNWQVPSLHRHAIRRIGRPFHRVAVFRFVSCFQSLFRTNKKKYICFCFLFLHSSSGEPGSCKLPRHHRLSVGQRPVSLLHHSLFERPRKPRPVCKQRFARLGVRPSVHVSLFCLFFKTTKLFFSKLQLLTLLNRSLATPLVLR